MLPVEEQHGVARSELTRGIVRVRLGPFSAKVGGRVSLDSFARLVESFSIDYGPIHARGVPAILTAVTGVVCAGAIATAVAKSADRLPETLREARGLAEALRDGNPQRLPS